MMVKGEMVDERWLMIDDGRWLVVDEMR